jgi:hypothetical protein
MQRQRRLEMSRRKKDKPDWLATAKLIFEIGIAVLQVIARKK